MNTIYPLIPQPIMNVERACNISRLITLLGLCFVVVFNPLGLTAQTGNKTALTAERTKIEKQLATTTRLINEAKKNRNAASSSVVLIDKQIELRERLIRNHQASIRSLERSVNGTDSEIRSLEGHIVVLKDEYASMIIQSYRIQLANNPLMFVFAAEDFSQAALRFKMLQSYTEVLKGKADEIVRTQETLTVSLNNLHSERTFVEMALADHENERISLKDDRVSRAELLAELKQEESSLRKTQKAQEKERKRLNAEIEKIIEAEIAAERASSAGEYALTPEGRIVSEAFEKNKKSLPWPVSRGVVTAVFGRHNHPTIPGIVVESNGIDITTDAEAPVYSVFSGTVSSVFSFPGAGETIIITHGGYRTVYSNLDRLEVVKGDNVERGTQIGIAWTGTKGTTVHFEVWKVAGSERSPQNPKSWLQPR